MADQDSVIKKDSRKTILILAANPKDTKRLSFDEEISKINEGLKRSKYRDQFKIHSELAIDYHGLRRALLDYEPYIVHFIGHGEKGGLMLKSEFGLAEPISSRALSRLFKLRSRYVKCVILNACYAASQADVINKHINYVIGMPGKINDKSAVEFSVGFYDALGAGEPVEVAFEFGCDAVEQIEPNLPEQLMPVLKKKRGKKKKEIVKKTFKTPEESLKTPLPQEKPGGGRKEYGKENSNIPFKKKILKPTPIIFLVLMGVVAVLLLYLLILEPGSQFGPVERVETRDNILIVFDAIGNIRSKNFHSKISRYVIVDIDKDKENDILLGFSADGNESGRVIALDSKRKEKWRFSYNSPYRGVTGVKLGVSDIKMFDENLDRIIAVLLREERWDLSVLVILNSKGEKLKKLWYPGYMQQIEKIRNTYIIRAVNNDLRQAKMSKNLHGNSSVVFGLKYENIYGEAPPYLGMFKKNVHFEWYFFLTDQKVKFKELSVLGEMILAPTTCGKGFYFNEKGPSNKVHFTDDHSCKDSLQLAKLRIAIKEDGEINLSIPTLIPTTERPTERPIEIEANLSKELRDKGLLEKLREASAYCKAGSFDGENEALGLYLEVINELSPGVRKASKSLKKADSYYKNKHYSHALREYKALFDKIINNSGRER